MENMNNDQESSTIIKGLENLNSEGCMFFIEAGSEQVTRMTSTQLRWLTHKKDNGDCFTNAQRQAIEKIDPPKGALQPASINPSSTRLVPQTHRPRDDRRIVLL